MNFLNILTILNSFLFPHFLIYFVQIENTIKQKLPFIKYLYGKSLIDCTFKPEKYKLKIPFGDTLQKAAYKYFDSVREYYRNTTTHELIHFDYKNCVRVLIIASELLDIIEASVMPFKGLETVDDLVKKRTFKDRINFFEVLNWLEGQYFVDEVYDGFFEEKANKGITDEQYETMFEFGLLETKCGKTVDVDFDGNGIEGDFDTFELTPEGAFVKSEIEKNETL